ncbi:MAG: methionyl-tRNA formyltransferase [Gammaproteobacteria bacterium]
MNILYIGSSAAFSLIPFKKLLASAYSISAVGVYKPLIFEHKVIALENESLALSAQQHAIPVIDLSLPVAELIEQISLLDIDLILMSCYSRRLPDDLINLAKAGCFNMHPSLLPRYRGPEPVFWQMKQAAEMGVSWHLVTHDLDAGDIVKQQKIKLDDGLSFEEINRSLANTGAELMLAVLADLSAQRLLKTTQDQALASYYPYPEKDDFTVDTSGSAQRAYNFMRATQVFGHVYHCDSAQHHFLLDEAIDYDNNASQASVDVQGNRLYIPFNEGVLIATYTGKLSS